MFVGCSEISISVIVKHVQHIGIGLFVCVGDLLSFSVLGGRRTEKIGGISSQADTMDYFVMLNEVMLHIELF